MKKMATKLASELFVLSIVTLTLIVALPNPLNAGPKGQGQFARAPDSYAPRLWRDHDKIDDLKDVLFDFDADESISNQAILQATAVWLKDHPNVRVRRAGYTEPRGNIISNLILSQKRAETVKRQLVDLGVGKSRIVFATGWGELYPNCLESTEECWKQNRRVEFLHAIY